MNSMEMMQKGNHNLMVMTSFMEVLELINYGEEAEMITCMEEGMKTS